MAKNKIETSGKWLEVNDDHIHHVWACNDEDCKDFGKEVRVQPDWYQDNGTPVCACDQDMNYLRTEIKI